MESERVESYLDLLPPEIGARINRLLKANPTFAMIMDLPYEVQRDFVVVQMPYPDVLRFCATSKAAKRICDDDYFWKLKIAHDFPENPVEGHEGRWRELYKTYWKETSEKLISCARDGHLKCVESSLQLGVDPNFQTKYRDTALMRASEEGHLKVVQLLLKYGANPNIEDSFGETALIEASSAGHTDIVQLLLEHGADPNFETLHDWAAINMASRYGRTDIVRLLLNAGADPQGALYFASRHEHADIVALLSERS